MFAGRTVITVNLVNCQILRIKNEAGCCGVQLLQGNDNFPLENPTGEIRLQVQVEVSCSDQVRSGVRVWVSGALSEAL